MEIIIIKSVVNNYPCEELVVWKGNKMSSRKISLQHGHKSMLKVTTDYGDSNVIEEAIVAMKNGYKPEIRYN